MPSITIVKSVNMSGCVGFWSFDEGAGSVANDYSGNGNTGLLVNGPTWVDGVKGKALDFNLVSSYVLTSPSSILDSLSLVSIAAWIKIKSVANGTTISKNNTVSATTPYEIQVWGDGRIYFNIKTVIQNYSVASSVMPLNQWIHAVLSYDGTTLFGYINGKLVTSLAATGVLTTNSIALRMGGLTATTSLVQLDDVRIYNRALSQNEILAIYGS